MVVAGIVIYDAKPLLLADGSLDVGRIYAHIERSLPKAPGLRQRLAYTPLFNHPVWVDADEVDLDYHISRAALPRPGDTATLMELVGRIYTQPLERDRPLWDLCIIEGLRDDRFALLMRLHHALGDGGSSNELLRILHTLEPTSDGALPQPWIPRPQPRDDDLLLGEVQHRLDGLQDLAAKALDAFTSPRRTLRRGVNLASGLLDVARTGAEPSPLNGEAGSRRRVDWFTLPLDDLAEIRGTFGGTVNDVVLTLTAGALRRYLADEAHDVDAFRLRVACPSDCRRPGATAQAGNHTTSFLVDLPTDVDDPLRRYRLVRQRTRRAKSRHQADAVQFVIDLADHTLPGIVGSVMELSSRYQNLVISNITGPPTPIYMLESSAHEIYPLTLLTRNSKLAITVLSYNGRLSWSLCADWDSFPTLVPLQLAIRREFESFRSRARRAPKSPPRRH